MKKLALDHSDFPRLRKDNCVYVDKTMHIARILEDKGMYYFLARPRRFGKSLFISTLESFFKGEKELFEGLYIDGKTDWKEHGSYPVIRMNFSQIDNKGTRKEFEYSIIDYLDTHYASLYDIQIKPYTNIKSFLSKLILGIYRQTGKPIVLLIDEYDKPITDHINNLEKASGNRDVLRDMYDWIKNAPSYWKLVFLTGISKFSKMSVFSVLNNIRDISEKEEFNETLGFTTEEIKNNFADYLLAFAQKEDKTVAEIMSYLKFWYNGYSWGGKDKIYNPYSLLYSLNDTSIYNYWYSTGTPKMLVDFITNATEYQNIKKHTSDYENLVRHKDFFNSIDLEDLTIEQLLYQTGYLTIDRVVSKNMLKTYYLNFPNHEVRYSFTANLLHHFYKVSFNTTKLNADQLRTAFQFGDLKLAKKLVRTFFNQIPHELRKNTDEAYYHSLLQMLLMLIGVEIKTEESTPLGRIDGVLRFPNRVYILELKYANKGTMETLLKEAILQINKNKYFEPFEKDSRPVTCLAIGFLEKKRKKGKQELTPELEIDFKLKD